MTLPVAQVINLDRSADRLRAVADRLDAAGLAWARHKASEVTALEALEHPLYRGDQARKWFGRDLSTGEIGCYLSHLSIFESALARGDDIILVLEDDALPAPDAKQRLTDLVDWLRSGPPAPVDWIHLSRSSTKWTRPLADLSGLAVARTYRPPLISSASLWTRKGILGLQAYVEREGIARPVDNAFRNCFSRMGTAAVLDPPLFCEADVSSTIGHDGPEQRTRLSGRRRGHKIEGYLWSSLNRLRGT